MKRPNCLVSKTHFIEISVVDGKRLLGLTSLSMKEIKSQKWWLAMKEKKIKKVEKIEISKIEDLGNVYKKLKEFEIIIK